MKRLTGLLGVLIFVATALPTFAQAQSPRVKWEELTAADFVAGLQRSQGVCMLPFGILEKHGPHLPLGTDLINVRKASLDAAAQEYAIVFPEYYFGQIFEAKSQPGTMAYSLDLQLKLLQETTDEMARNGCKKIMIVNGHGGNESLLPLFGQAQMATEHDYVVYIFGLPDENGPGRPKKRDENDMHAGESETSATMISRPDLVQLDKAGTESGADEKRQSLPQGLYTGIWWYARFPNHYSGNGSTATKELGAFEMKSWTDQLVNALRAIKKDEASMRIQKEFYDKSKDPLKTKQ